MRSDQSKTVIAFYSPEYRGSLHFFGCASLGFAGGRNAKTDFIRRFPVELEAMEISGSYDACIREAKEAAGERQIRACIALTGNVGNENVFCRELYAMLRCPIVGGGAAIDLASNTAGLLARGGEANLLLITDDRFCVEVNCKNIHTRLSRHTMTFDRPRVLLAIDGEDATDWLAAKKVALGLQSDDWEHLTFSDGNGINAHFRLQDSRILSGRDLERNMDLRILRQEDVQEAMQSFYADEQAIIFGCAGLRGLLEREIETQALGLFLFGEICYTGAQADFGNLMLSKLRIRPVTERNTGGTEQL